MSVGHEVQAAERWLRDAVRSGPGLTVLTGGQTGVDTDAALAALRAGFAVHLIFPAGYRQEDGPLTVARRRRFAGAMLHEVASASFRYRTWTCAYLADAIVLLDPAGGAGCRETVRAALQLGRPLLRPAPGQISADQIAGWLASADVRVLMVAGCRASLLARTGEGGSLQPDLAAIMVGARQQDQRLRRDGAGERIDPSWPGAEG